MENKRVLLGMSGGVDSSVSALLLKEAGYEVIGATLELFAGSSCCNINTYIDAKNVCNQLEYRTLHMIIKMSLGNML